MTNENENTSHKLNWTMFPRGAYNTRFSQQNSNLMKQLSRSKVKVKYAHFYSTYRTDLEVLSRKIASNLTSSVQVTGNFLTQKVWKWFPG